MTMRWGVASCCVLLALSGVASAQTFVNANFAGVWTNPFNAASGASYICQGATDFIVSGLMGNGAFINAVVSQNTMVGFWGSGGGNINYAWGSFQLTIVDGDAASTANGQYWYGSSTAPVGGPFAFTMTRLSFTAPSSVQCWDSHTATSITNTVLQQQLIVPTYSDNSQSPFLGLCPSANANSNAVRGSITGFYPQSIGTASLGNGPGKGINVALRGSSPDSGKTFQGVWFGAGPASGLSGDCMARGVASGQAQFTWWNGATYSGNFGAVNNFGPVSATNGVPAIGNLCTQVSPASSAAAASVLVAVVVAVFAALLC